MNDYETAAFTITVGTPLLATTTSIICPPNTPRQINVGVLAGITGGCTPSYQLNIDGVPTEAQ
ncbi:MAG: hypothetical protein IPG00_22020 [Saprospiraceae bacterium]|nr:hypothetical protein [Saprospiraceae bacterium]